MHCRGPQTSARADLRHHAVATYIGQTPPEIGPTSSSRPLAERIWLTATRLTVSAGFAAVYGGAN
jgi:hypothetical protein